MAKTVTLRGVWLGGRMRPDMNGMIEAQADLPDERQVIGVGGLHATFPLTAATNAQMPAMGAKITITITED